MTIVPLLKFALNEELKQAIETGSGIELSQLKYISKYDHAAQGDHWDRIHYAEGDPNAQLLQSAKYAVLLKDDSDSAGAQTIVFFMKIVRDGDILIDCWHRNNQGGEVRNINFNNPRAPHVPAYRGEGDPWEAVRYTAEDIGLVGRMCRSYFETIVPQIGNNNFLSVFNAINFSRVAFSITSWDQRLFLPMLGTAIECLFSYGRTEITHQIGENIAWFLEPGNDTIRVEWYRKFKHFYGIRSDIIHNGYSDKSIEEQQEAYADALDILRFSIKEILLNNDKLEKFRTKESKKHFFLNQILNN